MVNMQPGDQGNEFWYPQLPEGYEGNYSQSMPAYEAGGWQDGMDMGHYEMQRFPGGGFPGQGMPEFRPGGGFPGQGMPGFPPGGGFPGQGFPPGGGFPGQGSPGFPPGGGFPGGPQGQQRPTSPPPQRIPEYPSIQAFAVDPGAIRGCLYRYTFVWLSRRQGFWFFPVFVGRNSVAGCRWRNRQRRWEYTGIALNQIDRFSCFN